MMSLANLLRLAPQQSGGFQVGYDAMMPPQDPNSAFNVGYDARMPDTTQIGAPYDAMQNPAATGGGLGLGLGWQGGQTTPAAPSAPNSYGPGYDMNYNAAYQRPRQMHGGALSTFLQNPFAGRFSALS